MANEGVAPWMPAGDEDVVQITKLGQSTSQAGTASQYDTFTDQDLVNLRKEWKDVRTNPDYNFFSRNNELFQRIKAVIRGKSMTKGDISKLARFLMGDQNESEHNRIDDCIRWYLINFAIEDKEPFSAQHKNELGGLLDPRYLILGILLQEVPQIAFELSTAEMLRRSCVDLGVHHPKSAASDDQLERWRLEDEPESRASKSPFHTASHLGLATFVKAMIQLGYHFSKTSSNNTPQSSHVNDNETDDESKEEFTKTLRLADNEGNSALYYASKKSRLDVITELLDFHWTIACPPDPSFSYAVKWFIESVVDKFLAVKELHRILITEENLILVIQRVHETVEKLKGHIKKEERDRCGRVTEKLFRVAKEENIFTQAVAEKIIELELTELWPLVPTTLSPTGLLHTAVRKQKAWFVEKIAERNPESITEHLNGKYALWHNNFERERTPRKEPSKKIRTALVDTIIRKTKKMEDLADILYQSGVRELCFDLSHFNSKSYRLNHFAESLINHRENAQLLSYEPLLKYAEFPALDLHPDDKEGWNDNMSHEHEEIFVILDWLSKSKEVTTILELQVRDRLYNPHDEHRIAQYVEDFKVETLNWRFLDLSISVFKNSKERLTGIHLYASGKQAPISHWFSKEGLQSLPNLEHVYIHIVQDMIRPGPSKNLQRDLKQKLRTLRKSKVLTDANVDVQPWNPKSLDMIRGLDEIGKTAVPKLFRFIDGYRNLVENRRRDIETLRAEIKQLEEAGTETGQASVRDMNGDSVLPGASRTNSFEDLETKKLRLEELEKSSFEPTKVAILDNGILSVPPAHQSKSGEAHGLWSRIKEGRSFVDDANRSSPWLFASNPHGTQMANLICAVDPTCELYVAKVTEGRYGISPGRVAKAINWARSRRVDVISMSFAILDDYQGLSTAIAEAAQDGILMLASTHDEGLNHHKAYPANYAEPLCVTACDEYGTLPQNPPSKYDYRLHGTNISAGVIPFLVSDDRISGSSVATAIAAGLSSLTISCDRLCSPGKIYSPRTIMRKALIEKQFSSMVSSSSTSPDDQKYIILEKFADFSSKTKDGERVNIQRIIEEAFGDRTSHTNGQSISRE